MLALELYKCLTATISIFLKGVWDDKSFLKFLKYIMVADIN